MTVARLRPRCFVDYGRNPGEQGRRRHILVDGGNTHEIKRWFSDDTDTRSDLKIMAEILEYIQDSGARSVVVTENIIGCPHEEGIDYPNGEVCPVCPYRADPDRWTGELLPLQ